MIRRAASHRRRRALLPARAQRGSGEQGWSQSRAIRMGRGSGRTAFGLWINHILPEGSGSKGASNASAIPLRRGRKGEGRVGKRLPVGQTARS